MSMLMWPDRGISPPPAGVWAKSGVTAHERAAAQRPVSRIFIIASSRRKGFVLDGRGYPKRGDLIALPPEDFKFVPEEGETLPRIRDGLGIVDHQSRDRGCGFVVKIPVQ